MNRAAFISLTIASICTAYVQRVQAQTQSAMPTSCKQIHAMYPGAYSAEYSIQLQSLITVRAYCDMMLNGGGYTFFHPTAFYYLTPADVAAMVTNTSSVILRTAFTNGQQKYGLLQQLDKYSSQPLSITLNGDPNYNMPQNSGYGDPQYLVTPPGNVFIGKPFLEVAFLSKALASNYTMQGFKINGMPVQFYNCDAHANSYFSIFPNLYNRPPTGRTSTAGPVYDDVITKSIFPNPYIPQDYLMFLEFQFGGCGGYFESNSAQTAILGANIGFR